MRKGSHISSSLEPCTPPFMSLMIGAYVCVPRQPHGVRPWARSPCALLRTRPSLGARTYTSLGRACIPSRLAVCAPYAICVPLRCAPPIPIRAPFAVGTSLYHTPLFAVHALLTCARPYRVCLPSISSTKLLFIPPLRHLDLQLPRSG
jgi:hypothetical protein